MVFNENIERVDILGSEENETRLEMIRKRLDSMFVETETESMTRSMMDSGKDIIEARDKLVEWFRKNRLDVKLENEKLSRLNQDDRIVLNIMDSVYIHPPYRAENCVSTNEIILNRVRNLINSCV